MRGDGDGDDGDDDNDDDDDDDHGHEPRAQALEVARNGSCLPALLQQHLFSELFVLSTPL